MGGDKEQEGQTDISPRPSKSMPPTMQLKDKTPRHADAASDGREEPAGVVVDVPDCETGDEDYFASVSHLILRRSESFMVGRRVDGWVRGILEKGKRTSAPSSELLDFFADFRVGDTCRDDGARFCAYNCDHEA